MKLLRSLLILLILLLCSISYAETKIEAGDAADADNFGYAVAISGDYSIVGAYLKDDAGSNSGSAYIFQRNGENWQQTAKLTAADAAEYDYFGSSVSISGDYSIVGAYGNDDAGSQSGSAYIFQRNGENWQQTDKLTAADAASDDRFGYSVSISGDYCLVGAYNNDDAGSNSGSAYIFKRNVENWQQTAKLTAADAASGDWFGCSVSISGDYCLVGAYFNDDAGSESGSAYIFKRNGEDWQQTAKLTAADAASGDWFGCSVSISGDYCLVGAYGEDTPGSDSGAAYLYDIKPTAVNLIYFKAKGAVNLSWETATELDNVGYHIWRSSGDGYERITIYIIPSQGGASWGAVYSYYDPVAPGIYQYKLEDIEYDGTSTMHGPIVIEVR